ncbi:hypothetical protein KAR91_35635, partial [Candidatus Pacearchaeota archaeon]|nr:hypothetical protein [Candidatus Pacearchaeota archaeon]
VDVDLDHEVEEITTEDLPELMRNEDTLGLSFLLQDMVLDPKNMPTGTVTSVGVDCGTYIGTYVVDSSYSQCKCGQNVRPCGDTLESGHGPFLCCGEWK